MTTASPSSGVPAVTDITFYRSGVAYVERRGSVDRSFTLNVNAEGLDDFLATVSATGPVAGIAFESRPDASAELNRRGLAFSRTNVLRDFITKKCVGHEVSLHPASGMKMTGRVLGLETSVDLGVDGAPARERYEVILAGDFGHIHRMALAQVTVLEPKDEALAADLKFYLTTSRTDETTRALEVQMNKGGGAVSLNYLVPAALWRTKYDVAVDLTAGTAQLTLWAVATNPLSERVESVRVRFTTGQPMSFLNGLNRPVNATRSTVTDSVNVAAPSQYRSAAPVAAVAMLSGGTRSRNATKGASRGMEAMEFSSMADSDGGLESASAQPMDTRADVADAGPESEFSVGDVTLPPGGAITLALVRMPLNAEVLRVWREGGPATPELALKLTGPRSITVERGPVSLTMNGRFVGQAMVPYSGRDRDLFLPYAFDQALHITAGTTDSSSQVARVYAEGQFLLEERQARFEVAIEFNSAHATPVTALVEIARRGTNVAAPPGAKQLDSTPTHWRFVVEVAPGVSTLKVPGVISSVTRYSASNFGAQQIAGWLKDDAINRPELKGALAGVAAAYELLQAARGELQAARIKESESNQAENSLIEKLGKLGTLNATASQTYSAELTKTLEARPALVETLAAANRKVEQLGLEARAAVTAFFAGLTAAPNGAAAAAPAN